MKLDKKQFRSLIFDEYTKMLLEQTSTKSDNDKQNSPQEIAYQKIQLLQDLGTKIYSQITNSFEHLESFLSLGTKSRSSFEFLRATKELARVQKLVADYTKLVIRVHEISEGDADSVEQGNIDEKVNRILDGIEPTIQKKDSPQDMGVQEDSNTDFKKCVKCGKTNVPSARVLSICDECLPKYQKKQPPKNLSPKNIGIQETKAHIPACKPGMDQPGCKCWCHQKGKSFEGMQEDSEHINKCPCGHFLRSHDTSSKNMYCKFCGKNCGISTQPPKNFSPTSRSLPPKKFMKKENITAFENRIEEVYHIEQYSANDFYVENEEGGEETGPFKTKELAQKECDKRNRLTESQSHSLETLFSKEADNSLGDIVDELKKYGFSEQPLWAQLEKKFHTDFDSEKQKEWLPIEQQAIEYLYKIIRFSRIGRDLHLHLEQKYRFGFILEQDLGAEKPSLKTIDVRAANFSEAKAAISIIYPSWKISKSLGLTETFEKLQSGGQAY